MAQGRFDDDDDDWDEDWEKDKSNGRDEEMDTVSDDGGGERE